MELKDIVILNDATSFKGEIKTGKLILEGTVKGVVKAKEKVILKKGSILEGEVIAGNFTMSEGANFMGKLLVEGDDKVFTNPTESPADENQVEVKPIKKLYAESM